MDYYEVHAIPNKRKKISKPHSINTFEEFTKRNKVFKFSGEEEAINFAHANNEKGVTLYFVYFFYCGGAKHRRVYF